MYARRGINAGDPKLAEIALADASVAISELQPAQDRVLGKFVCTPPRTPITLGHLEHFFMATMGRRAACCPRHLYSFLPSSAVLLKDSRAEYKTSRPNCLVLRQQHESSQIRQQSVQSVCISRWHNTWVAQVSFVLARLVCQLMAQERMLHLILAGCRLAEA